MRRQNADPLRDSCSKNPNRPIWWLWKFAAAVNPRETRRGRSPRAARRPFMRETTSASSALRRTVGPALTFGRAACCVCTPSGSETERAATTVSATRAPAVRMRMTSACRFACDTRNEGFPRSDRACCGPTRGPLPPRLEPGEEEDLDRAGDRDRRERAEHTGELRADQHRDEDGERRELHRPAVDDGLKDVVLDLLIDDEEGDDDEALRGPVEKGDGADDDRGERGSGERNQIQDRDEQGERYRVGDAENAQHDRRGDSCDDADQEVARHVAADRAVDVPPDPAPALTRAVRQEAVEALQPRRAFEEHEEGHEQDRHRRDDGRDDPLCDRQRRTGQAENACRPAFLDGVAHALGDVVFALEESEPAAPVR